MVAHLLGAVGARVAEAPAGLEVALAIDAVAADEGAVLPIRPVPALGFTPGEGGGRAAGAPTAPGNLQHPPAQAGRWGPCVGGLIWVSLRENLRAEPHREPPALPGGAGVSQAPSSPAAMPAGSAHPCPPLLAMQKPTPHSSPWAGSSSGAGHCCAGLNPAPCRTHRSPIQPGLQWEHLPLMWLQVWPSLQGGHSFSQPSP